MRIADGPKFINCASAADDWLVVRRRLYDQQVSIDCDIQAQPVVHSLTVEWPQSPARNVTLSAGRRNGYHLLLLQDTNTSVGLHVC